MPGGELYLLEKNSCALLRGKPAPLSPPVQSPHAAGACVMERAVNPPDLAIAIMTSIALVALSVCSAAAEFFPADSKSCSFEVR